METKANGWYAARGSGGQGIVIEEGTGRNVAVTYEEKDAPLAAAAPEMAELDHNGEPYRAWLEVQDWFQPWTQYLDIDGDTLLEYCRAAGVYYQGE